MASVTVDKASFSVCDSDNTKALIMYPSLTSGSGDYKGNRGEGGK